MKKKIIAVVLALAGLALIVYGVLDFVYFGLEMTVVYATISGVVSVALAVSLFFYKFQIPEKKSSAEFAWRPYQVPERMEAGDAQRSGLVLAAAIISIIGVIMPGGFYAGNFAGEIGYNSFTDAVGGLFWAQFFWGLVGCVCLFVGYFRRARWAVLVGSICECLAAVCWMIWLIIYALPIIFGFIGYAKMKKQTSRS